MPESAVAQGPLMPKLPLVMVGAGVGGAEEQMVWWFEDDDPVEWVLKYTLLDSAVLS